ncbi:MAG: NAD(P)-dependent dehydrogenase (short-subunit alcohol dehydrogenase family) [Alphaproteobacteria bacterium]|jgi:NAD(P)-dependent dehydrogenase (short-subunit alcohol dehydrogenase family)
MEDISLDGKVALITGASRGMGREMALAFIKAGAKGVTITAAAASDESRKEIETEFAETIALAEKLGGKGRIQAIHADVCKTADCEMVVNKTVDAFGALHILCSHAGKSQRYHGARDIPFWETDPEGYRLVIETNVVGPYLMARAAVPQMLKNGWGRIIHTSKSFDSMHEAHAGAYGPSKAGLEAEAMSWAEELAGTGITVNSIQPGGAVATKFGRGETNNTRGLPVEVMVPCALWIASDLSKDINGCRFDAKSWNTDLPGADAALACREPSLFPKPEKPSKLDLTWEATA